MLSHEIVKELIKDKTPEQIIGKQGILKELQKQIIEAALQGEMTDHLGYEKHERAGKANSRNGYSKKKLKGQLGTIEIEIPRDRAGSYEPKLVKKSQTRFDGFDETVISMYARGMSTSEIQDHLKSIYTVEVSAAFISTVTEKVMDDVIAWQNRPLEATYPIVYMDAIRIKVRHENKIVNKAVHLALGVNLEGHKELLGMWIGLNEGASFWLGVLTELQNRGVQDIYVACVDGLKGFPDAINAVFPRTAVQLCIVHMIRNSLKFISYRERKVIASDLRLIYTAPTLEAAELELRHFGEKWDSQHPQISKSWHRNWAELSTFFAYPPAIRKILYTTNPVESVNAAIRKVTKNRNVFPNDKAVKKILYLAIKNASSKWGRALLNWGPALSSFTILYEDRMPY